MRVTTSAGAEATRGQGAGIGDEQSQAVELKLDAASRWLCLRRRKNNRPKGIDVTVGGFYTRHM